MANEEIVKQTANIANPTSATKLASQDYINQMYDANLKSQQATLQQGYDQNLKNLDTQQAKTQQQTDTNLNRTYVEALKGSQNFGEVKNAYGLTSGAMAQARLAQENQLNADLTALRGVQANADAEIERERALLAKTYASEIAKAQADNDMARAEALYKDAKAQEERLWAVQENVANLFANKGDYSLLQQLYGLSAEQMAQLMPAPSYGGGSGKPSGYDPALNPWGTDPNNPANQKPAGSTGNGLSYAQALNNALGLTGSFPLYK